MDLAISIVGVLAVSVVVTVVRARGAATRRDALQSGGLVRLRAVRYRGRGRGRSGHVVLAPGHAAWSDGADALDLAGAQVVALHQQSGRLRARPTDVELVLVVRGGETCELVLHADDARTLVDAVARLGDGPSDPAPVQTGRPRRRRRAVGGWPAVVLGLCALWLAAFALLLLPGRTVEATVASNDDAGTCDVRWTGRSGEVRTAEVHCADPALGEVVSVRELARPLDHEALDLDVTPWVVLVVGGLLLVAGVGGVAWRHRPRRAETTRALPDPRPSAVEATGAPAHLARLGSADVVPREGEDAHDLLTRLAPYAHRAGGLTGSSRVPPQVGDLVVRIGTPLILLGVVLLATGPQLHRWVVLHTAATAVAAGAATGEVSADGLGPVPDDVRVRFADGRDRGHVATVATGAELAQGEEVVVRYAVSDPGQARLEGADDRLARAAGLGAVGLLATTAPVLLSTARLLRLRVLAGRVARRPGRLAAALLVPAGTGRAVVVLADPAEHPVRLLSYLAHLPGSPGPHGATDGGARRLAVSGDLVPGGLVVARTTGRDPVVLTPLDRLRPVRRQELVELLDPAAALR